MSSSVDKSNGMVDALGIVKGRSNFWDGLGVGVFGSREDVEEEAIDGSTQIHSMSLFQQFPQTGDSSSHYRICHDECACTILKE